MEAHICRIVVYLTDIRYREAVYQEMGKWLGRACIRAQPGWLCLLWRTPNGWLKSK